MSVRVVCPGCKASYNIPDNLAGRQERCHLCSCVFAAVRSRAPEPPPDVEVIEDDGAVQSRPGRSAAPRPATAKAGRTAPTRRGDERTEGRDSRRPRPEKKKGGALWVIGGVLGGLFLLCAGGVTVAAIVANAWLNDTKAQIAGAGPSAFDNLPREEARPPKDGLTETPVQKPKDPPELPKDPPAGPKDPPSGPKDPPTPPADIGDGILPAETLAQLKSATAFIKVQFTGRGLARPLPASGSGFLIKADGDAGLVVTNHHVVAGPADAALTLVGPPTLVFGSGTKSEQSVTAEVVATDPDRDLALLRVANVKDLPRPIDLGQKPPLAETMPVYILGFPFGEALSTTKGNPGLTIGRGSVSSLRENEAGQVSVVQLDGDLNPGNSGGPVLDKQGRLIGVAVARVRGSRIGFAIPAAELQHLLLGGVAGLSLTPKLVDGGSANVLVEARVIDPSAQVKSVALLYAPADPSRGPARAEKDGRWPALPGAQRVELKVEQQKAVGSFRVPPGEKGQVAYSVQVSYVNGAGETLYTQPRPFTVDLTALAPVVARPPDAGAPPEVRPPALAGEKVELSLPAAVADVCVGGGGRFLILHLPKTRQLAVFDANEGKVVKYLPVAEDDVKIAAGLTKLFVALPNANLIQRWDLTTLERDVSAPLPTKDKVSGLCMGSAWQGPLMVCVGDGPAVLGVRPVFLDAGTLKESAVKLDKGEQLPGVAPQLVRASADGSTFVFRNGVGGEPHTVSSLVLTGGTPRHANAWIDSSLLTPSPDGRYLYGLNRIYSPELKEVYKRPKKAGAPGGVDLSWGAYVPAHQHGYYMEVEAQGGDPFGGKPTSSTVSFYLAGQHQEPFAKLDGLEPVTVAEAGYGSLKDPLDAAKRVHLIPDANLLVILPITNDKLVLRTFDVTAALEKSGKDYLLVTSRPVETALKGQPYSYQVTVKARKKDVKYRVEAGPKGMTVSKDGLVSWAVPADQEEGETDVIITVSDGGQEIFHTFKVRVARGEPGEGPKPPEAPADPPKADSPPPDVPAEPAKTGIKAPTLDKDKVVRELPDVVDDVAVGGAGRYIVLHLPKVKKLAIFDANEAKITNYVTLADENVKFAANVDKLLVVNGATNVLTRYNLATAEKETAIQLQKGTIRAAVMGSAAQGPLVLGVTAQAPGGREVSNTVFIDPKTMKGLVYRDTSETGGAAPAQAAVDWSRASVRVSADGRVFAFWNNNQSPQGIHTVVLAGGDARHSFESDSAGPLVPAPDGRVIYTGGRGLWSPQAKPLGKDKDERGPLLVPAAHGNFYLGVPDDNALQPSLYALGDARPLALLPDLELGMMKAVPRPGDLPVDKRVHFLPDAKMIVSLPDPPDKLVLTRFDVEQALQNSAVDYLLVTSQPPAWVKRGTDLTYQMAVKSKKGGVTCKLESGPKGMEVSADGLVKWSVPANVTPGEVNVIVTVRDTAGQEAFHNFSVDVRR